MALVITKKVRTILLIVLGIIVVGAGGFLIWRVSQEDSVAPTDSEAYVDDPKDCQCSCGDDVRDAVYVPGGGYSCVYSDCTNEDYGYGPCGCYGFGDEYGSCYTVNYDGNGGSCNPSEVIVQTDKPSSVTVSCSRSGYTVSSFTKVSGSATLNSSNGTLTNVTSDVVVKANWTASCTGCDCDVSCSGDYPLTSCPTGHDCSSTVKTCTKVDSCGAPCGGTKDITCFKDDGLKSFTVSYDSNGGTCTPTSRTVDYGTDAAKPSCTRSGYNLAGFTRTSGSGGNLNNETGAVTNVTGNQTIQATWSISCGDGTCAADEDANSCPADCPANCGDGYCTHDEDANSCPADCSPSCGDGYCTHDENAYSCPSDCDASCGDGYCTHDEDASSCPEDCDADCGDGFCTGDENPQNCPADCDDQCGDGLCTGDENAQNCPADCIDECGDGYCTGEEDSNTCPEDCEAPIEGSTVPQTGLFDTMLARVSLGVSFMFLGGLVSQYSRINYFFNSISERNQFRREIKEQRRKERHMQRRREKLEDRFKRK